MTRLRRQLDADCELGLFAPCMEDDLTRVVSDSVQSLWAESSIKLYLSILALQRARDQIRGDERWGCRVVATIGPAGIVRCASPLQLSDLNNSLIHSSR